ncbi:hypothetical protein DV738_g4476, partial [Chaetothyriales sp. CBS 135597]
MATSASETSLDQTIEHMNEAAGKKTGGPSRRKRKVIDEDGEYSPRKRSRSDRQAPRKLVRNGIRNLARRPADPSPLKGQGVITMPTDGVNLEDSPEKKKKAVSRTNAVVEVPSNSRPRRRVERRVAPEQESGTLPLQSTSQRSGPSILNGQDAGGSAESDAVASDTGKENETNAERSTHEAKSDRGKRLFRRVTYLKRELRRLKLIEYDTSLQEPIEVIKQRLDDFKSSADGTHAGEEENMALDLFQLLIPELVFLLRGAVKARILLDDLGYAAWRELITLMSVIVQAADTAYRWRPRPRALFQGIRTEVFLIQKNLERLGRHIGEKIYLDEQARLSYASQQRLNDEVRANREKWLQKQVVDRGTTGVRASELPRNVAVIDIDDFPLSAPKAASATSLSKPPVRSTTAAIRKPPVPTTTRPSPAHPTRASLTSVDGKAVSDDAKKDGLSAKPKRVSLASTSTSATRASGPTSARPTTPGDKQAPKTVAASPSVVQSENLDEEDNKENVDSESSKSPRSVLLEQKLREVELVKESLERALTEEGTNETEAEDLSKRLSDVAKGILASLKKFNQFEKEHGRAPSGDELVEIEDSLEAEASQKEATASVLDGADAGNQPNPLEEELAQSRLQIESLQRQFAESSLKVAELTDAHDIALKHAAAEHDSRLKAQQEELQQQLDSALQSKDSHTQQAVENALKEHGTRVDDLVASHESNLAELAEKHERELAALRDSHQQALDSLHDQAANSSSEHDNQLGRLTEELRSANEQLVALQSQLAAETTSSKEELEKLRNAHQNEIDSLTAQNIKSLQDASADHSKKLEDMVQASALSAIGIEELKTSHKAELESVDAQHSAKIEDLLSSHEKLVESLKSKHADEVEELTGKHTEDLAKLRRDHQSEIEQLSTSSKALQDKFKALESESATKLDRITQLESQLQTSDNQIADLKAKLASADQESAQILEQLAANHNQKVADLRAVHDTALQQLKTRLDTAAIDSEEAKKHLVQAHSDEIESVKTQHESVLRELKEAADAELESLKATHKAALEQAQSASKELSTAKEAELDLLRSQLASHTTELEQAQSARKELSTAKDAEIDDLRSQLATIKAAAAAQESAIEAKYAARLQEAKEASEASSSTHDAQLQQLREEHSSRIKDLESQIATAQEGLDAAEVKYAEQIRQANEAALAAQQKAIEDVHQKHEAKLKELEESHAQQLEHTRDELRNSHDEHLKGLQKTHEEKVRELSEKVGLLESSSNDVAAANSRSEMLKAMFQNAEKEKEEMQKEFEEEQSKLNDEIGNYVSKLAAMQQRLMTAEAQTAKTQEDLGDALAKAESAEASTKEIEDLKERLQSASLNSDTLETEVQELKSKLAITEKQVADWKAELIQLKATSSAGQAHDAKQDSTATRKPSGLAASKWASKDPDEGDDSPDEAAPALDPVARSFSSTTLNPETDAFQPSPTIPDHDSKKSSNIAGQLAGIQHQVGHLQEISSEMLQDNEILAAKLNNAQEVALS